MRTQAAALVALLALSPEAGSDLPALPPPTADVSPARGHSGMPQLTLYEGRVLLSWIAIEGATATLRFSERDASAWTAARTVATGADWFVNWADVPSVLRLGDTTLAAHWLQKNGSGTYAYDVRLAFSGDNGASWSASTTPHHDRTETEHGFASLFRRLNGGVGLIWLDGRAMKPGAHGGEGAMTVRAAAFDSDGRQAGETLVDDRVCECCPTAAAVTDDGPVVVYRDRAAGEVRDIYLSRLAGDAWTPPGPVHADNWVFPACPVNGPAISATGRRVAVAWFTMRDGVGQSYVAFSSDSGRTFAPPIRADDGTSLGRVDVELLDNGRAAVSWLEFTNERTEFRVRLVSEGGQRGPAQTVARVSSSRSSGYPRLAKANDALVLAWTGTETAPSTVRTAVISLR